MVCTEWVWVAEFLYGIRGHGEVEVFLVAIVPIDHQVRDFFSLSGQL